MKKNKYSTPEIMVEELSKKDVLCASAENNQNTENPDNIQQSLLNFASWWD